MSIGSFWLLMGGSLTLRPEPSQNSWTDIILKSWRCPINQNRRKTISSTKKNAKGKKMLKMQKLIMIKRISCGKKEMESQYWKWKIDWTIMSNSTAADEEAAPWERPPRCSGGRGRNRDRWQQRKWFVQLKWNKSTFLQKKNVPTKKMGKKALWWENFHMSDRIFIKIDVNFSVTEQKSAKFILSLFHTNKM